MVRMLTLSWLTLTLLAVGCTVDPINDCQSLCEEQRSRMCNGFVGDENCVAQCSTAAAEYDSIKADADRIGCSSQFDNAYGCASGGDPCDGDRCNAQTNELVACGTAFCTVNPTDRVCPGP